jgi:transcriptional regulator with XRE-family HTH domain
MATTRDAKAILETLMERKSWDAQELASQSGVPFDTLRKWLKETTNPSVRRLSELVNDIGEDPTEFGLLAVGTRASAEAPPWADDMNAKLDTIIDLLEHRP